MVLMCAKRKVMDANENEQMCTLYVYVMYRVYELCV